MSTTRTLAGLIGALTISVSALSAHANLVANGGFETDSPPSDWTFVGNANGTNTATDVRTGSQSVVFKASDSDAGSVSQGISGLLASATYALEFYMKGNLGAVDITFGGTAFGALVDPDTIVDGDWTQYSAGITGVTGGSLRFSFDDVSTTVPSALLDDVSISCRDNCTPGNNQTPEPGSLLLVGAALAGLGVARRRFTRA